MFSGGGFVLVFIRFIKKLELKTIATYVGYMECRIHQGMTNNGSSVIRSSPALIFFIAITLIPLPHSSRTTKLSDFFLRLLRDAICVIVNSGFLSVGFQHFLMDDTHKTVF